MKPHPDFVKHQLPSTPPTRACEVLLKAYSGELLVVTPQDNSDPARAEARKATIAWAKRNLKKQLDTPEYIDIVVEDRESERAWEDFLNA